MGVEKDNIKDLFSAKLGGNFEPEVPASVWAGIDQLLPKPSAPAPDASSASSSTSTASSSTSILKVAAIATGIAASVATGILIFQNEDSLSEEVVTAQSVVEAPVDSMMIEEYVPDSTYEFIPLPPVKRTVMAEVVEKTAVSSYLAAEQVQEEETREAPKQEKIESLVESNEVEEVQLAKKNITSGLSIGLLASADVLSGDVGAGSSTYLMSPQSYTKYFNVLEKNAERDYEMEHSQPVSIGLAVEKRITPKISIGTGIVYTYLSSVGKSSGVYLIDEKQVFHYLGIPLSLNYTFYELKKAKFYISAGGMVQKDIQGRYTGEINMLYSQLYQNEQILGLIGDVDFSSIHEKEGDGILKLGSSKNKISQNNPQLSARITIGASWPIYDRLSIYGTVGGAYYFDAGNEYRTIYSDQKTQLDLNIGLKIDF